MRKRLLSLAFCLIGAVPLLAAAPPSSPAPAATSEVKAHVTVFMTQDAQLVVNGKPADIDATKAALADLKTKNGVVWYAREHPKESMSVKQEHLFVKLAKIVSDLGLPIELFTDDTFTTVDRSSQM